MTIQVNRAPVLTLWAAVVAERLGQPADTALTLGRAVAGAAARVKARNIGREERKADRDADTPGLTSVDPIYYDTSYYLAPDGKAGVDVYAVLREAIQRTGQLALTRVVISQRERTVALRVMDGGLVAHTLNEQRDINDAKPLFEDVKQVRIDPEMVGLAEQLIKRQSGRYDPSDLEDRYETRLRSMIEAKLKGEGLQAEEIEAPRSNVIDLMAALKQSLGQAEDRVTPSAASLPSPPLKKPGKATRKKAAPDVRRQPGLKLPIKGGKPKVEAKVEAPLKSARKRA